MDIYGQSAQRTPQQATIRGHRRAWDQVCIFTISKSTSARMRCYLSPHYPSDLNISCGGDMILL